VRSVFIRSKTHVGSFVSTIRLFSRRVIFVAMCLAGVQKQRSLYHQRKSGEKVDAISDEKIYKLEALGIDWNLTASKCDGAVATTTAAVTGDSDDDDESSASDEEDGGGNGGNNNGNDQPQTTMLSRSDNAVGNAFLPLPHQQLQQQQQQQHFGVADYSRQHQNFDTWNARV